MMGLSIDIPVLETERLILRGWREDDLDSFHEIWADEENTRYLGGIKTRSETWRIIAGAVGHWALRGFSFFCVEEKSTGVCIGWAGPWRPEGWPDNEIGYALAPSKHGKGYATEAVIASMKYAYQDLCWNTAISLIDADNVASQNVAKKLGAIKEQTGVEVTDFVADIWRHLPPQEFLETYA